MFKTNTSDDENQGGQNQNKEQDDLELNIDASDEIEAESGGIEDDKENESVNISKRKLLVIKNLLESIKESNEKLNDILSVFITPQDEENIGIGQVDMQDFQATEKSTGDGRIVEGVFDGENMIGPDGKQYSVPANYASKSKLVEGDILKLTITPNGTFVYKQIGPIDRKRVVGKLNQEGANFFVSAEGNKWNVLTASVTYFKGSDGDEAVILVPKTGESRWGALENVMRKKPE